MRSRFTKREGFTLVEILVTSTILMLLMAVTTSSLNIKRNFDAAQDISRKSNLTMLSKAFQQYFIDNKCYPSLAQWGALSCGGIVPDELKPYLSAIPCDPETHEKYYYEPLNASCQQCISTSCSSCKGFRFLTQFKHFTDPSGVMAGCDPAIGCGVNSPDGTPYNWGVAIKPNCLILPQTPSPTPTVTNTPSSTPTRTPTPTSSEPFTGLSSTLITGRATFTFSYSGASSSYIIDMSQRADMSWDTYLTFAQGSASPLVITNPSKWDKYVCGMNFYWRVKSSTNTVSAIQHAIVDCGQGTPTATPLPTASPTPSDSPITKKVMVIDFNPILENQGNQRLRAYKNWNNPIPLETQFISDIQTASNGYFKYQIVTRLADVDAYPTKNTGYTFTDASYLSALSSQDANARAIINYNKVITDYDVCGKVNSGEIDELWLWGGPWFGYWEAVMAGPGAYVTNASPITGTTCNRKLHIFGFSYERGIAEMLEDFGHRTEGTIRTAFGGWFAGANTDWDKFTKGRAFHPNDGTFSYGCGSIHEPFNASGGYDWGNVSAVANTCSAWTNYPPAPTTLQTQTCSIWGCTGYGYLKMWLTNLPKATGQTNGKWNNWWKYLGDLN